MKNFSLIVFLGGLLAFVSPVYAATEVCDDIAIDTIWTQMDSPYVFLCNIEILTDATLTIKPGVVVKFANNTFLDVYGVLQVSGTSVDPVNITSIHNDAVGGDTNGNGAATVPSPFNGWGINFFGVGTSTLRNFSLLYSDWLFVDSSSVVLEDATIREGDYGFFADSSVVSISRMNMRGIERDAIAAGS